MTVRVHAPCRLHLGLFHVPVEGFTHWPDGRPVRKFGGVGLMIEHPAVTVVVRRSPATSVAGTLADRAAEFLRVIRSHDWWGSDGDYVVTANGPPEHVGLGVGTALGMAIACGVNGVRFGPDCQTDTVETLAAMVERGRRSGVGVFGFYHGGLIVDDGKDEDDTLPRIKDMVSLPTQWRIVLVRPLADPVWFGDKERLAFGRTRAWQAAATTTERLRALASEAIVPAAQVADFVTFAAAVTEFNRRAGEPFRDDQGGPYAGPEVEGIIDGLRQMGAAGVGQSSWGPTVFTFAPNEAEANALADRVRDRLPNLTDVTVTAANNTGARVIRE
jgi:beta-RFAP synthase